MSLLNTNIGPERVQVFSQPLGSVPVAGVATSVTAFLISTTEAGAPENIPTSVFSLEEFTDTFGGADEAGEGYYAVKGFFDNAGTGNTAIIVHVGTSATPTDWIGNAADGSGLRSLDPIEVLGLVCIPGLDLEDAYLVDTALIDYAETTRTEFGATLSTTMSLSSIPNEISKANTDVQVLEEDLIASGAVTGQVVSLDNTPDLSAITPGMVVYKAATFVGVITAVDDGLDTITLTSVTGLADSDTIQIKIPSAVTYKELVINNPSKTHAWYFNSANVLDEAAAASPGDLVSVDPVGHVAGIMARIDANISIGGVSHAPAGIQYAGIAGINGLTITISERTDAAPLRLNFINRLTSFPGSGFVVFGGYTSDSGTSPTLTADEQLIQVIRSVQYIKGSLERGLRAFLWENFSPSTQEQIERAIQSFLRNNIHLFPQGLPEAQQFLVISVEATQDDLDAGLLKVRVQIKPNKAVRFIEIALEFPLPTA